MLTSIGWLVLLLFLIILFVVLFAVAVLSPVLPSIILRASCSVADVKEPRYLVSFPLGYAAVAAYALLWWLFVFLLGRLDADPDAPLGAMHLCGYLLALTVGWLGTALLYRALLAPSFTKGFWVAGLQLVLHVLAAGLTAALVLAAFSVWQLLQFPMPGGAAPPTHRRDRRRQPAMILEGLVTTVAPDGRLNVAPMGPLLPDDPYGELRRFILRPFRTARTCADLLTHGEGVLHVTDDVLLLARAAVGEPDPPPPTRPARRIQGQALADACRWYEFRVTSRDDRSERVRFEVEVVHAERGRDFFGFNRAMYAVVEAAILATRVALLPAAEIEADFRRFAVLVEKTGGPRERQAFAFLQDYVVKRSQGSE